LAARTYAGWAQAFEVPAGGGVQRVTHDPGLRTTSIGLQGAALGLVVLLALPRARTREDLLDLPGEEAVP
jgi:hypothetical protein